jgi:serine/threonine-protein kinase
VTALCLAGGAGAALIGDNGKGGGGAASSGSGDRAARSTHTGSSPKRKSTPAAGTSTSGAGAASGSAPTTSTPTAPAADGRSAAQINNAGYAMLPGNPEGALPLLSQAVEKFRAGGDTSSTDYAYSLYNYGWALRLAGRPAEAIPYLEERLRISDYKRGIVEHELKTAQQQAGGDVTAGTSRKVGKGQAKAKKDQRSQSG